MHRLRLHLLVFFAFTFFAWNTAFSQDKLIVAKAFLQEKAAEFGLSAEDVENPVLSSSTYSKINDVSHFYFQQHYDKIPVYNAILNVHVSRDNKVVNYGNTFVSDIEKRIQGDRPGIDPLQALQSAVSELNYAYKQQLVIKERKGGPRQEALIDKGGLSNEDIPVRLVYMPMNDGTVRLAWELMIDEPGGQNYWSMRIDARTGEMLDKVNMVIHCNFGEVPHTHRKDVGNALHHPTEQPLTINHSPLTMAEMAVGGGSYRVYKEPVESPIHSIPASPGDGRVLVNDPADAIASPYGWHDTDGFAGAEFTITQGNNVHAYTDTNADNSPDPGSSPDGGVTLTFDFPIDLTMAPSTYRPAAVTNLFYWNNLIHDFAYKYGFDEASGNFQVNNYGNGGLGDDDVRAEAQDGGGINNANFFTPVDGQRPRMQMFLWNTTVPGRDGDFDNGVIAHEYGHGISNRLTGGPANVSCLNNAEQMGEGWSDWYALMMTLEPGDQGTDKRGIGTYVLGEPTNGDGIRPTAYSTDMGINPSTYDRIKTAAVPHGVGYVWATMIWDLTWALIDYHGTTDGFDKAMWLVNEGMKMQVCNPGFVDGRNAILAADQVLYSGENQCIIWEAFRRRGLGYSASQGNANNTTDGTEAFDLPPSCRMDILPEALTICAGNDAEYSIDILPDEGPVTLSATGHPAGTTVTFTPNPIVSPGSGTMTIGNTAGAAPGTYTIQVTGTAAMTTFITNVTLTVYNGAPAQVSLVSPANGATMVALNPTLSWTALPSNVEYYEIQVATDAGFANIVESQTGLTGTSYTVSNPLLRGTLYFWRVRAVNPCNTGAYSATSSFLTTCTDCYTNVSIDVPVPISQEGTPTITSVLNIPFSGAIGYVRVLNMEIDHTWVGDLDAKLTSPNLTDVQLFHRPGHPASINGCSLNNLQVSFDDNASASYADFENTCGINPAISGTFQPMDALSAFNGENPNGTWTLTVKDNAGADGGALQAWSLEICFVIPYTTYYRDADGDGYGNAAITLHSCETAPDGYVGNDDDCDDTNDTIYPGAAELCDGIDNDCNTLVDDNVAVAVPASITSTVLTANSVFIDWNDVPSADRYQVRYRVQGSAAWTTSSNVFVSQITLSGLLANNVYQFQVRARCTNANNGNWSATFTFFTSTCGIPANVAVSNITANSAVVTWSSGAGAISYMIRYRRPGFGWTTTTSPTTSKTLTGLLANTNYEVQVASFCSGIGAGAWTPSTNFTTASSKLGTRLRSDATNQAIDWTIFPNPALSSQSLTIQLVNTQSETGMLSILDLQGRVIWRQNWSLEQGFNQLTLNDLELHTGMYFVTIRLEEKMLTKRLIIQE